MGKYNKLLDKILLAKSDNNINFDELCFLLKKMGFTERIKGSHHIFYMNGIDEIINIQPIRKFAKSYQARQIRNIIIKYQFGGKIIDE